MKSVRRSDPDLGNLRHRGLRQMKTVTAQTFETLVLKSLLPVVVVIWGVG